MLSKRRVKVPITNAVEYISFFLFFKETSLDIVCKSSAKLADESHGLSRLIFSEKIIIKKKINKNFRASGRNFALHFKG